MAARDRQKSDAVPKRQQVKIPAWQVLVNEPGNLTLSAAGHLDGFKAIKPESLRAAAASFPGRDIAFQDPQTSVLYLNKNRFFDENNLTTQKGRELMSKLYDSGQKFTQYTMPRPAPSKPPEKPSPAPSAKPKTPEPDARPAARPKRNAEVSAKPAAKPETPKPDGKKRVGKPAPATKLSPSTEKYRELKKLAAGAKNNPAVRDSAIRQMRTLVGRIEMDYRDSEREWLKKNAPKPPKVVRERTRHESGEKYDRKRTLGRYQYVQTKETVLRGVVSKEEIVRSTSLHRMAGKRRDEIRREMTQNARAHRQRLKAHHHAQAQERQRIRQKARSEAFFVRSKVFVAAARKANRENKARQLKIRQSNMVGLRGYGVKPIHFVVKGTEYAKDTKGLPRDIRHPAANYAAKSPMRSPVNMGGVSVLQTLSAAQGFSGIEGTQVYVTTKTLSKQTFGGNGRGVFFRIDASEVMRNLTMNLPAAIRRAAVDTGKAVGKKLLDIIEPYVPKDTGLLYSTANTNVSQTAGGLVDIEGGEAYPAGQMFGVSVSYNAPYAELVYFDESKRHGQEYNEHYGTSEKGEKETARWIEKAFREEGAAIGGLVDVYARAMTGAMNAAGARF